LRYYHKQGIKVYPIKAFCNDIVQLVKDSMRSIFGIVLSLDANKNMYLGKL